MLMLIVKIHTVLGYSLQYFWNSTEIGQLSVYLFISDKIIKLIKNIYVLYNYGTYSGNAMKWINWKTKTRNTQLNTRELHFSMLLRSE